MQVVKISMQGATHYLDSQFYLLMLMVFMLCLYIHKNVPVHFTLADMAVPRFVPMAKCNLVIAATPFPTTSGTVKELYYKHKKNMQLHQFFITVV